MGGVIRGSNCGCVDAGAGTGADECAGTGPEAGNGAVLVTGGGVGVGLDAGIGCVDAGAGTGADECAGACLDAGAGIGVGVGTVLTYGAAESPFNLRDSLYCWASGMSINSTVRS